MYLAGMGKDTTMEVRLVSTADAAKLLGVSQRTVVNWIKADRVRYVELPGGNYRIPLSDLLSALGGTFDMREVVDSVIARQPADAD